MSRGSSCRPDAPVASAHRGGTATPRGGSYTTRRRDETRRDRTSRARVHLVVSVPAGPGGGLGGDYTPAHATSPPAREIEDRTHETAHTRSSAGRVAATHTSRRARESGLAGRSYIIRHSSTQRISTVCAGPHPTFYDVGHITRPPLSCLSDSLSASACSRPPACHKPLSHSATNLYRHWRRRHSSLGRLLLLLVGHPKEVVGKQDPQLVGR